MFGKIVTLLLIGIVFAENIENTESPDNQLIEGFDSTEINDTDYVSENLQDLKPKPEGKIVSPDNDRYNDSKPSVILPIENGDPDAIEIDKPVSQASVDNGDNDKLNGWNIFCDKIEAAIGNARKEIGRSLETFVEVGKSFLDAKKDLILSIPKAGMAFLRGITGPDGKS